MTKKINIEATFVSTDFVTLWTSFVVSIDLKWRNLIEPKLAKTSSEMLHNISRNSLLKILIRSDRFPYYKSNDDRWKNSVRHNLSINPHFRKGNKAKAGAGHLWKISSRESEANFLAWEHVRLTNLEWISIHLLIPFMNLTQKKQRLELFFKMEAANLLKRQEASRKESLEMGNQKNMESINSPSYDAELNAATASIISLPVDTSSPIIATHGDVSLLYILHD